MNLDALAELERLATYQQVTDDLIPEWSGRPLLPWEVRSGISFTAIDRIMRDGYSGSAEALASFQSAIADDLADVADGVTDPDELAVKLVSWAATLSPALREQLADTIDELVKHLQIVAGLAGGQVLREAAVQGVRTPLEPAKVKRGFLANVASMAPAFLLNRVREQVLGLGLKPEAPAKVARAVSPASTLDLARQAVHVAHGAGRSEQAAMLPRPERVYSSEILDRRTCSNCRRVDGTQYDSVASAEQDYPNSGPYRSCKGGARCRGTLVFVWPDEAPATR